MRTSARAIVINDDKILIVHRNKFGIEYDTLPGGVVNIGENIGDAAVREAAEETSIQVKNPRLVFIDHAGEMYGDQFVFLCEYISGDPAVRSDTMEYKINEMGKNLYEPMWLPTKELKSRPFVSENLKDAIINSLESGWPEQVQEFSSNR